MNDDLRDLTTPDDRRQAYLAAGHWDDATLSGQVRHWARQRPSATAVVDEAGRWTYAELASDVGRVVTFLLERGVGPGHVVSIQLPNRYETTVAAVATQAVGAVINPLLPSYRQRELAHVFTTARPSVVFTPGTFHGVDHPALVAEVSDTTGVRPTHVVVHGSGSGSQGDQAMDDILALTPSEIPATAPAEAVSELIFTSGTEAVPKAIMHTEQTAGFSVRVARADLGVTDEDVVWMPSPIGHSTGFNYGVRFAFHHGLPLVLQDRWSAETAIDLITAEGCSYTLAATTFLQDLVEEARRRDLTLPTFRLFGCGGAPVPAPLVAAARDRGIGVLRLYGSTEVLVGTWNRPTSTTEHLEQTDGVALSHVEVTLDHGDEAAAGSDGAGEIVVRGPNTCVGFFRDPERTAATFRDGWVRSGDLGTIDDEGYLRVVGRKKEILIRGGMNIAPREIEDLIAHFPEVNRVAIVGLPDERLGERMCACIVLRPGATLDLDSLVTRLRAEGLAPFKLPQVLRLMDALPMTASGKVQKHEILRALAAEAETPAPAPDPTSEPSVLVERRPLAVDGATVAVLTLNRPASLNALDEDTIRSLSVALDDVEGDDSVRAVLVTGAGRAFSAGGDLKRYIALQTDAVAFPRFVADLHHTLGRLRTIRVPTLALVNGVTAAGGLELLLNCDLALIGRSARIGDAHLNFGQMGGGGVLTLLPRAVGRQRAAELVFSGEFLDADEAVAAGLGLRVVDDETLLDAGIAFAETVAAKSALAVANAKEIMHTVWSDGLSVDSGLRLELERNAYYCLTSEDAREGLQAFSDKRRPRFTGR